LSGATDRNRPIDHPPARLARATSRRDPTVLRTLRPATLLKAFALAVLVFAAAPDAASAQLTPPVVYEAADVDEAETVASASRVQLPAIGIGLAVIGGGLGIGLCGFAATGAMARQPEIAGQIQTAMLIAAVLIEGATIIGLAFCLAV
ncbi:ATP synthase F0 subunit C, partial [Alienimonas chondri]|uniref:ATP synthase F0 subunit C n=1 Tax=Alienimonas chondri TaxID=2681879 RepID=UPI001FE9EE99